MIKVKAHYFKSREGGVKLGPVPIDIESGRAEQLLNVVAEGLVLGEVQ